jgi:hypothetical protein
MNTEYRFDQPPCGGWKRFYAVYQNDRYIGFIGRRAEDRWTKTPWQVMANAIDFESTGKQYCAKNAYSPRSWDLDAKTLAYFASCISLAQAEVMGG